MSADNGVYILSTKDKQYRVKHFQGVDWLYDKDGLCSKNVVEEYKHVKCTRNKNKALWIASRILEKLTFCEYGINFIKSDKTWNQILIEGREEF